MKKLFILTLLASAMAVGCGHKKNDAYSLSGTIEGADGQSVYLMKVIGDSLATDTAVIKNSGFIFEGSLSEPVNAMLLSGTATADCVLNFVLEPGDIEISGISADNMSRGVVKGSATNDKYMTVRILTDSLGRMMAANQAMMMKNSSDLDLCDSLRNANRMIETRIKDEVLKVVRENPDSYFFAQMLERYAARGDRKELLEVFNALSPEVQDRLPDLRVLLETKIATPGEPAPELKGKDPEGNEIRLSDLKGKVVFLDFWSTWCGPCRRYFPHLKELFEKYHDDGLEVFCVANNDNDPEAWRKFIDESPHGMSNYHHILRGLRDEEVGMRGKIDQTQAYEVYSLPTKYLIDRDGNVIGKFDKAEDIDNKLKEIFGK